MEVSNHLSKHKELSILIAEDNELSLLHINIILNDFSNNIVHAKDGQEALSLIEKQNFDIALLDVNLPIISGLEVANRIIKKYPALGIIMNSAFSSEEDRQIAMKKNNFYYLSKPLKKEKIIAAIEKVLAPSV